MPVQRTWTTYNYIALWFSMSMEVTTYMLAASLIAGRHELEAGGGDDPAGESDCAGADAAECACGGEVWNSVSGVCAGELWAVGRIFRRMLRAVVACGWFGIQSWIGGTAIAQMVNVLSPGRWGWPWVVWVCFYGFWLLNMFVVWRGVESIRFLQSFSAPFMLIMSATLLIFMLHKAGGIWADAGGTEQVYEYA